MMDSFKKIIITKDIVPKHYDEHGKAQRVNVSQNRKSRGCGTKD